MTTRQDVKPRTAGGGGAQVLPEATTALSIHLIFANWRVHFGLESLGAKSPHPGIVRFSTNAYFKKYQLRKVSGRVHLSTEHTHQPNNPEGLDLKLLKRALKETPELLSFRASLGSVSPV